LNIRQIQEARELYGIDDWGAGYFSINDQGDVVCHPTGEENRVVELPTVIEKCIAAGLHTPLILRFPQVIETQLERMHSAFRNAMTDCQYQGKHRGVFPFKVNQRREFIDHIVSYGKRFNYGLEVGSKTEFVAALSYPLSPDSLLICNGFKDREFIHMGFIATAMGKNVIVVVEGPEELQMIIDLAKEEKVAPMIGLRSRLYSRGSGKWEKSSGETSKFGLTTIEVLQCLDLLNSAGLNDRLAMLHFHIGSQITEIKRVKNAIKEASRVYSKILKMGFTPRFLNIGGGVGVDYDGSKTSFQSSANYSLQEFANDVVYVIGEVCANEKVAVPDIVTESGRVIAAYHSVVATDIREVQGPDTGEPLSEIGINFDPSKSHKCLIELKYIMDNINKKNYVEYYHDATEYYEELFTLFNLGYLKLHDRAIGEELFHRICHRALYYSSFHKNQLEEFENLQKFMVSKYLANFSIFQSIPDAWSIDQLFPVMPLTQHDSKPNQKATIVDITCDSDGCLDTFIDRADVKTVLDLHRPSPGQPYYLGFFLVGAYQESLSNEHNLFGAINEAEVIVNSDGTWDIQKFTKGDPIDELLQSRNYDIKEILNSYKEQIKVAEESGLIKKAKSNKLFNVLRDYTRSLPYLRESGDVILGLDDVDEETRSQTISRLLAGTHGEAPSQ
jgi:arginine decarboxylase